MTGYLFEMIFYCRPKEGKGFKGAYVVGNRKIGECIAITLWETEADAMEYLQIQIPALFNGLFSCQPEHLYEVRLEA